MTKKLPPLAVLTTIKKFVEEIDSHSSIFDYSYDSNGFVKIKDKHNLSTFFNITGYTIKGSFYHFNIYYFPNSKNSSDPRHYLAQQKNLEDHFKNYVTLVNEYLKLLPFFENFKSYSDNEKFFEPQSKIDEKTQIQLNEGLDKLEELILNKHFEALNFISELDYNREDVEEAIKQDIEELRTKIKKGNLRQFFCTLWGFLKFYFNDESEIKKILSIAFTNLKSLLS